jgi:hypothetical protein
VPLGLILDYRKPHSVFVKLSIESNRIVRVSFAVILLVAACSVSSTRAAQTNDFLNETLGGHWLAQTKDVGIWWCEGAWKVGRERGMPAQPVGKPQPVTISAARGEYESVQVILRPALAGELVAVEPKPVRGSWGRKSGIWLEVHEVAYVQVTRPTDSTGAPGWYPDPLPALQLPLALRAGQNQPLWLTVYVPRDTKPGDYHGELKLTTSLGETRVPLRVHVYDFVMPEKTHLKSALGLGAGTINHYHNLKRQEDKEAVFNKYLNNFAEHRISPYSFYDYAPIGISFAGDGTNKHAVVDFSKFDPAAERWLDGANFSTFQLRLHGMGGGTFHSRHLGELEGFQEGTPEYARLFRDYLSQIQSHLEQRGWLPKAFTYWFDEPAPKDFEFVVEGMKRLAAAAPGIKRMLTVEPEPPLMGYVDIWCGLTPKWTPALVSERRQTGEEVWWYICCGPHAPYITEFIDHPGTELRLWPWQSWQYRVQGILIWETSYWTSPAAFPPPKLQDPWTDPMSYKSGYGEKPGEIGYWGNGDGRFLYPPRGEPAASGAPCLDGPVNSLRWENLRDGMEDYEYFWLLRQAAGVELFWHGDTLLYRQACALLKVPTEVSQDLTHFTTDPGVMLVHRDRVARMIERLQRAR